MFYALKASGHEAAERLVDLLTELDEVEHGLREKSVTANGGGWHELATAA